MLRPLVVVFAIALLGSACKPEAPTKEFADAMAEYETVLSESMLDYTNPRFDGVIASLRGVSDSNRVEHQRALETVQLIERERAKDREHKEELEASVRSSLKSNPLPSRAPSTASYTGSLRGAASAAPRSSRVGQRFEPAPNVGERSGFDAAADEAHARWVSEQNSRERQKRDQEAARVREERDRELQAKVRNKVDEKIQNGEFEDCNYITRRCTVRVRASEVSGPEPKR